MKVRTIRYAGVQPVCEIECDKATYYLGFYRMIKESGHYKQLSKTWFDELPYEVQKEYLLWRMTLGS